MSTTSQNAQKPFPPPASGTLTTLEHMIQKGRAGALAAAPGWVEDFVIVTPEMAREILKLNTANRAIRPTVVQRYAETMKDKGWKVSPQGLVISRDGTLLDGQHRLEALILADVALPFYIWRNVDPATYAVLDRGTARTVADALRQDRGATEVAGILVDVYGFGGRNGRTDTKVGLMLEAIQPAHKELMTKTSSKAKVITSGPFRAAAVMRILEGKHRIYTLDTYYDLVMQNAKALGDGPASVLRAVNRGELKSGSSTAMTTNLLARAWKVFDPASANLSKIQVTDPSTQLLEITEILDKHLTPDASAILLRK